MKTYNINHVSMWNGGAFTVKYNLVIDNACETLRNLLKQKKEQGYIITEDGTSGVSEWNYFCFVDKNDHEYMVKIDKMK